MFAIIVTEKGGEQRRLDFDKSEVTIGRVQGNDVILPKGNVSKRHARIVLKDGKFIIVNLKSTNGTYVNGRKITSPLVVKDNDKIYIGDFILGVDEDEARMPPPAAAPTPAAPPPDPEFGAPVGTPFEAPAPVAPPPVAPPPPAPPAPPRPTPPAPPSPSTPEFAPPSPPPSAPERAEPPMPPPREETAPPAPPAPRPRPPRPAPSPVAKPRRLVGAGVQRAQSSRVADRESSSPIAAPSPAPAPASDSVQSKKESPRPRPRLTPPPPAPASRPSAGLSRGVTVDPLDEATRQQLDVQQSIIQRVVARLDLDNVPLERLCDEDLWEKTESAIVDLVETLDSSGELPGSIDQDLLIKEALNEALALGPLEDMLADEEIEEIIVDRRDRILVGRGGAISGSGKAFSSDEVFTRVVERLVAPTGYSIGEEMPLVDLRLRDGSRLAAAVPPVAVRGACLTLRKPHVTSHSLSDMIAQGAMSAEMGDFLTTCVTARQNILVCGAPGSGKSAVLSALAGAAPQGERIVSVEEVAELSLDRDEWISLEARPGSGDGRGAVDLQALLRGALRMRPDRLIVGDVRGGEALELISVLASSHDGAVASIAGDGPQAALDRLALMARFGAPGASVETLRELCAAAVHIVVHVARYADGVYRVASIGEVRGVSIDGFDTRDIFSFRGTTGEGGFSAAGVIPEFYATLEARGLPADTTIFRT